MTALSLYSQRMPEKKLLSKCSWQSIGFSDYK